MSAPGRFTDAVAWAAYYTSLVDILCRRLPGPLTDELARTVAALQVEVVARHR